MIGVAVKGLLGRKTRALLTALAIILGVSMVSGTYVLTDTINKAFTGVLVSTYKNTSVVLSGKEVVAGASSGNATLSEDLLQKVRAQPDVQAAAGGIVNFNGTTDLVKLIDKKGKTIGGKGGAPTFGFGLDPRYPQFNPMKLVSGKWATGPGQVVVEQGTASKHGLHVGGRVGASADGPTQQYTIVGIAKLGSVSTIGAATIAVFDVPTAQKLLHKPGQLDVISVAGRPGVSDKQLLRELAPLVPSNVQVETGQAQGKKEAKNITAGLSFIKYLLLAFAAIALFVGSFVIFNTIAITVAQRTREFATLRTLGASRRQVLRAVLVEAFLIGLAAAVIGLFLGLAIAKGLNAIFVALGADLPQTGTVFARRTVIVSLLAGVIVTLLAGIFPALQATRVPPIAAVREGAVLPRSRFSRWSGWIAVALLVLALALLADGLFLAKGIAGVLLPLGVGTLLLFIGVALVSGRLVKPLAAVVGSPARRAGGTPGRLASENSTRNPGRTANTAAALMIGLALITFVATLGKGLKASDIETLKHQVRSDYVATAGNGFDPFPAEAGDAVARAPGVTLAASVRSEKAQVFGETVNVAGIGPEFARAYHFDWKDGPHIGPQAIGALVSKTFADRNHLTVGDLFTVRPPSGKRLAFGVQAIFDPGKMDPLFDGVMISRQAFDNGFPRPKNLFTFVNVRGEPSDSATAALRHAQAGFPDVKLRTRDDWVANRAHGVDQLLQFLYVLLALSVIVSLFGMVNTLVLSVFERTRELGMLRAIGMTRRQVRRMIRHERDHGADRGWARAAARAVPGGARDAGARERGRRVPRAGGDASRVRGGGDLRGDRRRGRPRATCGAAQRAPRIAVRVGGGRRIGR